MTMTSRPVDPARRFAIAELRNAIRTAESDPSPASLSRLDAALACLPLNLLEDDAERMVRGALATVEQARDSHTFVLLSTVLDTTEEMLTDGPTLMPVHTHPAPPAAVELVNHCYEQRDGWPEGSAFYRAWDRAVEAAFGLLSSVVSFLYRERAAGHVKRSAQDCTAAVQRAIAYRPLFLAREAMANAARGYGLFVIGGRQPLADEFHGAWTREIGAAVYRFEVTPYGWLIVTRLSDGVLVHTLALTDRHWQGGANSRISKALYAI